PHINGDAELIVLVRRPVEAGHAVHLVLGAATDENVVTTLTDEFVKAAATQEDVVTSDVIEQERIHIVAGRAVLGAFFDPVVAFIAGGRQIGLGTLAELRGNAGEDEVVALAAKGQGNVIGIGNEVFAFAAEDDIAHFQWDDHVPVGNHVIAGAAIEDVGAATTRDDVVADPAEDVIVAGAAIEAVVAFIAPQRVVAVAGDDDVVAGGAAEHDVVFTSVAQVIGIGTNRIRVVPDYHVAENLRGREARSIDDNAACRIVHGCRVGTTVEPKARVLLGRI